MMLYAACNGCGRCMLAVGDMVEFGQHIPGAFLDPVGLAKMIASTHARHPVNRAVPR